MGTADKDILLELLAKRYKSMEYDYKLRLVLFLSNKREVPERARIKFLEALSKLGKGAKS